MAFFMDPGAMFLGCLNGVEQKFLIELIKTARRSGYTRFVEPCAGTFAMANLAVQSGFKPEQIETSDVNMMTSVMGYAITGQSLEPLQIHAQGFSDEELLDPAVALYAQIYLRTSKSAGNEYFHNILRDLHDRREEHIESIRRQLEATKSLLGGMSYRPLDMWDHLREVKDDPHTIIVANPPTYFAGYEKFYDTQGKMTWKEPSYGMFDPETGHQQLYDMMMDAPALLLCYQEKRAGEAVGHTIFARSGTRADLNSYITTNREEEAVALAKGKKIKRPQEGKLEPLKCSMLPLDYEITEDSDIRIIQIAGANAQYYRMLWTHNFVGSQATYNRAVLIDGYVAAVFGISKMAADSIFVWYVMKAPHKLYRLGRLCQMKCFIALRFCQFGNRDSCPARYDFGNFFLCYALVNHRLVAFLCLFFGFLQLFLHSWQISILQLRRFFKVIIVFRHFNLIADGFKFSLQTVNLFHRTSLIVPFCLFAGKLFTKFSEFFL